MERERREEGKRREMTGEKREEVRQEMETGHGDGRDRRREGDGKETGDEGRGATEEGKRQKMETEIKGRGKRTGKRQ